MKYLVRKLMSLLGYAIIKLNNPKQTTVELSQRAKLLKGNCRVNKVVDIGANEGQFALDVSLAFSEAQFFCFEPLNDVFLRLSDNVCSNKKITLYNVGLGSKNSVEYFNRNEYSPSSSILEMNDIHKDNFDFARSTTREQVIIKCLDDYWAEIKPDMQTLVKIDVQGYEDKVLDGGSIFLQDAGFILIEMSFRELYQGQKLYNDIYYRLMELGFEYIGCIDQLLSPVNSEILQADSLFRNKRLDTYAKSIGCRRVQC